MKHSPSGLGPLPSDTPGTRQLVAEPLMKAVSFPLLEAEFLNWNKPSMAKLETYPLIVRNQFHFAPHPTSQLLPSHTTLAPGTALITNIIRITGCECRKMPSLVF